MTPYINVFTGTAAFVALSATHLPFKGSIRAGAGNTTNNIQIQDVTNAVPINLLPSQGWVTIEKCDLKNIAIKGNTYTLEVMGVTDPGW